MKNRVYGKRALATLATVTLLSTGTVNVVTPAAFAETQQSVTGASPRGSEAGIGAGTLTTGGPVAPGGLLTISGSGFAQRTVDGAFIGLKINDGAIKFPVDQSGADAKDVDSAGTANFTGTALPKADGTFSSTVRIPADLQPGNYWVRLLAGNDGDTAGMLSKYVWFTVDPNATATQTPVAATAKLIAQATSDAAASVKVTGAQSGEVFTAKLGDTAVKFAGRPATDKATAGQDGSLNTNLSFDKGLLLAGQSKTVTLTGDKGTVVSFEITGVPVVKVDTGAGTTPAIGSTAKVVVSNLVDGTQVSNIGIEGSNFLSAAQASAAVAKDGQVTIEGVAIPNDASIVGKEMGIVLKYASGSRRLGTGLKFTPSNAAAGTEDFEVQEKELSNGLYQVGYSAEENAIFVTRAVGRTPIKDSSILKLNADTLEVIKEVTPAQTEDGTGGLNAVYGVGVNDAQDQVWVTNTRQNTVAVYSTKDLSLIKQFPANTTGHSRDVVIDTAQSKAYVSVPQGDSPHIDVFDTKTLEKIDRISIDGFSPMSLDLDPATGNLYTVSLSSPQVAKIDTRNGNKATVWKFADDEVSRGSGVAFDPENNRVHVASQGSNNDLVIDASTGAVVKNISTGAGALNAEYNANDHVIYVSNFGADTITAIDAKTLETIGNIPVGRSVNFLESGKDGNVYAVTKGAIDKGDGKIVNKLLKINKKDQTAQPSQTDPNTQTDPNKGSSNGAGVAAGVGIAAAVIGVIAAVIGFAMSSGLIPANLIPAQLRSLLGI